MASKKIQQPTTKAHYCNLHFIIQVQGIHSLPISQRTLSVLSSLTVAHFTSGSSIQIFRWKSSLETHFGTR